MLRTLRAWAKRAGSEIGVAFNNGADAIELVLHRFSTATVALFLLRSLGFRGRLSRPLSIEHEHSSEAPHRVGRKRAPRSASRCGPATSRNSTRRRSTVQLA